MLGSMGAVLHFRICKGCLIGHGHSHLHSCSSGGHSHSVGARPQDSSDDEILRTSAGSSNGYQPLPAEDNSDVALLNNADDDEDSVVQFTHTSTNVNIRAAMVHVVGDLIQSVGVLTAAVIILAKVCCSTLFLLFM